jgi:hypothetical protein
MTDVWSYFDIIYAIPFSCPSHPVLSAAPWFTYVLNATSRHDPQHTFNHENGIIFYLETSADVFIRHIVLLNFNNNQHALKYGKEFQHDKNGIYIINTG